jgi:hypothetical protein
MKRRARKPPGERDRGSVANIPLPHERDEMVDPDTRVRPVIVQAADDLAAGQVDTDNYTRVAESAAQATSKRKR